MTRQFLHITAHGSKVQQLIGSTKVKLWPVFLRAMAIDMAGGDVERRKSQILATGVTEEQCRNFI